MPGFSDARWTGHLETYKLANCGAVCQHLRAQEDDLNARKRSSTSDSSFPHSWRSSSLK